MKYTLNLTFVGIVLVILKMTKIIAISWLIVLLPFYIIPLLIILVLMIIFMAWCFGVPFDVKFKNRTQTYKWFTRIR